MRAFQVATLGRVATAAARDVHTGRPPGAPRTSPGGGSSVPEARSGLDTCSSKAASFSVDVRGERPCGVR